MVGWQASQGKFGVWGISWNETSRQRTMLVDALRGHLVEFGIVTRRGIADAGMLIALVEDDDHDLVPRLAIAITVRGGAAHRPRGRMPERIADG